MRILLVATELSSFGGIQRFSASLNAAFVSLGHSVTIFESARYPRWAGKGLAGLGLLHGGDPADVVWCAHPRLGALAVAIAGQRKVPVVISTHGYETWFPYPAHVRLALARADVVTAVSKYSTALLGPIGRGAKLLPPTSDLYRLTAPEHELVPARERSTVTLISRLGEGYKGIKEFAAAAASLRATHPDLSFVASGRADPEVLSNATDWSSLEVIANPSDSELSNMYQRSAVVVLPSVAKRNERGRWIGGEGFGIVLLEAALFGAVTIASDEGACPELVATLGNGVVTDPTHEDLADALTALMADVDLRERLGARGRQVAWQRFSPAHFTERVAGILEELGC